MTDFGNHSTGVSQRSEADALTQALEQAALKYHKEVEGEYGCPGLTCPGVQRLIILLAAQRRAVLEEVLTPLMREDLEYWRLFLLRRRQSANGGVMAKVHIDHLTACAGCIGNLLKMREAALRDAPAAAPPTLTACDWRLGKGDTHGPCGICEACKTHEACRPAAAPQEGTTPRDNPSAGTSSDRALTADDLAHGFQPARHERKRKCAVCGRARCAKEHAHGCQE